MKEIGCSTVLYRNFSLKQALAGIQQAGGSAIELCARSSVTGQITHLDLNRHDDVNDYYQKVKQTITNHNLLIESIAVSNQQIAQPAELERLIEASHQLGTDTVVISSGGVSNSEESFLLFVDKISQACTILTGSQIRLSVKPRVGPGDNQLVLGCSPNFSGKGNTLKQIQEKTEQYTDLDRRLAVYIRFASPP
ncbi:TPA: hypothetical protein EYO57_21710 [Candidatus Poribacteria bacterium]|nr:hypothetical protein [Candidatus Poribacteria bacterium]